MTTAPLNTTTTGPIGIDDVLAALGEGDPFATNAGALQKLIGRGSNATVQKHLDAIRAQRAPVAPVAPGAGPTAPAEAVAAIWGAAWAAAQVHTLGRLERVTAEREQLAGTVTQLGQDLAAALAELDGIKEGTDALVKASGDAVGTIQAQRDEALEIANDAKQVLQATRIEFERLKTNAEHAAALATRDAQIAAQAMQATIDRLNDQVSDLKSLLIVRTTQQPEVTKN